VTRVRAFSVVFLGLVLATLCAAPLLPTVPHSIAAARVLSYVTSEGHMNTVLTLPVHVAQAPSNSSMETAMLALLNRSRAEAGRSVLLPNTTLTAVARVHGVDMFAFGYLSHRSRDGRTPWDRVTAAGVRPHIVGENLAFAPDVQEANTLLLESPGHRRNMLSTEYHRVGIGVVDGGDRGVIVVEDFTN